MRILFIITQILLVPITAILLVGIIFPLDPFSIGINHNTSNLDLFKILAINWSWGILLIISVEIFNVLLIVFINLMRPLSRLSKSEMRSIILWESIALLGFAIVLLAVGYFETLSVIPQLE